MSISDRLDEITARADAATEGPWLWTDDVRQRLLGGDAQDPSEIVRCAALLRPAAADAEFIAHARTDVPRLIAALRSVLDVCDRTEASIEPRGDFETGQASVTTTIRAVIAAALGEAHDGQ